MADFPMSQLNHMFDNHTKNCFIIGCVPSSSSGDLNVNIKKCKKAITKENPSKLAGIFRFFYATAYLCVLKQQVAVLLVKRYSWFFINSFKYNPFFGTKKSFHSYLQLKQYTVLVVPWLMVCPSQCQTLCFGQT